MRRWLMAELRGALEATGQFIAAVKHVIGRRGVPVTEGMRAPLRPLTATEAAELGRALHGVMAPAS